MSDDILDLLEQRARALDQWYGDRCSLSDDCKAAAAEIRQLRIQNSALVAEIKVRRAGGSIISADGYTPITLRDVEVATDASGALTRATEAKP